MRKTLLIFILFCSKLAFAQLNDNFSDGDFTNNPTWGGTTTYFQVVDGALVSNGPQAASTIYLSTANSLGADVAWEFLLNLSFDPSTTNYPRIYLMSNLADLSATSGMQAYYLQLGSSSNAENFALMKQNGSSANAILSLPDKSRPASSSVLVRVRVERNSAGRWDIYTDFNGGTNFTHDGEVVDNTYNTAAYFGVYCRYSTASRYNMFKFDDFKIETYIDQSAPQLMAVKSLNDTALELAFNEGLANGTALNPTNYNLVGLGNPVSVEMLSSSTVKLNFSAALETANYTISVSNLADLKGNVMTGNQQKSFLHIKSYTPQKGDVVINEIMAAPSSSALLNKEYIELYNTTDKYIIISGWKYKDASNSTATLPADTLYPKTYRILCAVADVGLYQAYGKTKGLSPWPSLNNDGDELSLSTANGDVIDALAYKDTWYRDSSKKTGYALELINPTSPCGGAYNWTASTATNQGTPGVQNAVFDPNHIDLVAPKILGVNLLSDTQVQVDFDKSIQLAMLTDDNNYNINNGIGKPQSVSVNNTENSSVILLLSSPILPNTENLLTVNNVSNCAGIAIDPAANTALLVMTPAIKTGDILLSEILFNPKTNGVDFVELYNATDKILDLKELSIANPSASGSGASKRALSDRSVYIRPKTYWVLTADPLIVQNQYEVKNPQQMIKMSTIPAFNTSSGAANLYNKDLELIDSLVYTDKMHHALLKDLKGVSLERVSFDQPAYQAGNLQSAAAASGFATPTAPNSQLTNENAKEGISLVSRTFSPDNDGFEDQLQIDYQFKTAGKLATVNIFDAKGNLVRRLLKNSSIASKGALFWDGKNDQAQTCTVGVYVLKFAVFSLNGQTEHFTKSCVLAAKLN